MPRTTCEALAAPWTLNCSIGQPTGANAPRLGAGRRWRDGRWSRRGMGTDQLDDPYRNDDSGCHSESEVAASEDSLTEREVAPQNGDQRVGGSYAGLGSDQAASVQRALQQKDPEHPRHDHGVRRPGEEDLRRTTRKGAGHRLHERRRQPEGSSGGDAEQRGPSRGPARTSTDHQPGDHAEIDGDADPAVTAAIPPNHTRLRISARTSRLPDAISGACCRFAIRCDTDHRAFAPAAGAASRRSACARLARPGLASVPSAAVSGDGRPENSDRGP